MDMTTMGVKLDRETRARLQKLGKAKEPFLPLADARSHPGGSSGSL